MRSDKSSTNQSADHDVVSAPAGQQSLLLIRIAATESGSLCAQTKS